MKTIQTANAIQTYSRDISYKLSLLDYVKDALIRTLSLLLNPKMLFVKAIHLAYFVGPFYFLYNVQHLSLMTSGIVAALIAGFLFATEGK